MLSACAKILENVLTPALEAMRDTTSSKTGIQGMHLTPIQELKSPACCTLTHEPVAITGTGSGKVSIKTLSVLKVGTKSYVKSTELFAALLLDAASPLHTFSSGKAMTHAEFCQRLDAYGCKLTRISSHRNLYTLKDLYVTIKNWLDVYNLQKV